MRADRLMQLAERLERIKGKNFSISSYGCCANLDNLVSRLAAGKPDTTACALGWCCVIWPNMWSFVGGKPRLRGHWDKSAFRCAGAFFQIGPVGVRYLFGVKGYEEGKASSKDVAYRIRDYVAKFS